MSSSHELLKTVLVAMACASTTIAAPFVPTLKHETHRVRLVGRDSALKLETFHPPSMFETFGTEGLDHPLAKREGFDLENAAAAFVQTKLGVGSDAVEIHSSFVSDVSQNAFVKQKSNGITFSNAVANVAFNIEGKVASFSSSFVKPDSIADTIPTVSLEDAIKTAEETLNGSANNHPATLEYLVLGDNTAILTHVIQVENDSGMWVEAFVDAHENKVVSITDFVTSLTYRVLPIQKEIVTQGFETLVNPENAATSPSGWVTTTTTAGNNAIAFKSSQTTGVASQSSSGSFVFTQDPAQAPTVSANLNAAIVNAFYVVNSIHDISYLYGFTESAFNFQNNNFGKGGAGNDRVTISVQDSAGIDNADFATPADGTSGRMRMFLWDLTNPQRDGSLENDIVSHENTHGITNRMTGGGTGRCLQTTEAGGMGEGWSDTMADWLEQTSTIGDYVLGQYVINNPAGIRTHPYSRSATTNPLNYASLKTLTEVHAIGEVWANTLHNVLAALVDANGWSDTAKTDVSGTAGNVVFMHLFIDALAIQPCNPTFLTARDAIIQADANRYAGANRCTLWRAFASKGLGFNAVSHNNDSTLPSGC
ncbi:Fungalysin metallopeptidase-domain-containing protein [Vararia minispora EC-137]|uniref:Fungalysin metallopeptidase-domain-containing protein n=1 Tax=Vararia minispora EC-137 TaxID=1314806 RepID=A0ACB8QQH2_9AGAM|nr:Fungalysin metallopeptidase-domain-containing protein [Vararia minispora EC-137]